MENQKSSIPITSPVFKVLEKAVKTAKVLVISGLPGVGKSLYLNQLQYISQIHDRKLTIIQWDMARKAFETPEILERFPIGDGVIHNGVRISVGKWLIDTLKKWLVEHPDHNDLLIIEAPLVGYRFIELAKIQSDEKLEDFLNSKAFQVLAPIPSKRVREKIIEDRRAQIADDAKTWVGAKPAVLLKIWKMICGIANEFGKNIPMEEQPPYDPKIYEFVFSKILKHRNFIPLHVDEIFPVTIQDEKDLHNLNSLVANSSTANIYGSLTTKQYANNHNIDIEVNSWYLT